jgi:translation initiation factor 1
MDLQDQLKKLFPDYVPSEEETPSETTPLWVNQSSPLICKYEKRNGKPTTLIEGYEGSALELENIARMLKTRLSVGGTVKNQQIILQGNYRDQIMKILQENGFQVKRVGG